MTPAPLATLFRHPLSATRGIWPRLTAGLGQTLASWAWRHRGRADLRRLDAHLLNDIGLTDRLVRDECDKPFWRD